MRGEPIWLTLKNQRRAIPLSLGGQIGKENNEKFKKRKKKKNRAQMWVGWESAAANVLSLPIPEWRRFPAGTQHLRGQSVNSESASLPLIARRPKKKNSPGEHRKVEGVESR